LRNDWEDGELMRMLRGRRFEVRTARGYGRPALGPRRRVFIARKRETRRGS
jgi:hypothetical protein